MQERIQGGLGQPQLRRVASEHFDQLAPCLLRLINYSMNSAPRDKQILLHFPFTGKIFGVMAILVDDFGAWLVAVISDSGRKKLVNFFTGTDEQGRALRSVATEAIAATARQLRPGDERGAEHLASVINEVFKVPPREVANHTDATVSQALDAAIAAQFGVFDDPSLTGVGRSAAEELEVSNVELGEVLSAHLRRQIAFAGSHGGPLAALANELNHEFTHQQLEKMEATIQQVASVVSSGIAQHAGDGQAGNPGDPPIENIALYVEQLLGGLYLGDHDEAERRMSQLFLRLKRAGHRTVVEALIREAVEDEEILHLASMLVEAADRLDHSLITLDEVEELSRSTNDSLRMFAVNIMWQWAQDQPGSVPVPLLTRLCLPSQEDWYVQAPARAVAKTLLLHRPAARAVFDRLATSRSQDDRLTAALDLLDVAKREPRVVPVDLANKLARDQDRDVASKGAELTRAIAGTDDRKRINYYMPFGL